MSDMNELRQEIDTIDRELVKLLDRRAEIARSVGAVKAANGVDVFDPARHEAVIERATTLGTGSFPPDSLRHLWREILSVSLQIQKPLNVAYLGPAGTFAHQAGIQEFGKAVDFTPCSNIREIFAAVNSDRANYGIVPIENSTGGMIHDSLDALVDYDCRICHERLLPIRHSLIANIPVDQVRIIYSHRQVFMQCSMWLQDRLPHVQLQEVASTVTGINRAQREEGAAAIGSHLAAEQYGLQVLAHGIEDNPDNTTRFLVIAHSDSPPSGDDKTSIMFYIKDRPGALFELLQPFARRGINLSKIESRPTKKRAWDYIFFVDLNGHRREEKVAEALKELEGNSQWLRVLGSYPRFIDKKESL